jgi:hypothetical protein
MSNVLVIPGVEVVGTVPPPEAPEGAPNPVAGFIVTTTDGSPLITLQWSHDGLYLDRFEILKRSGSEGSWERVALARAPDFGAFPNYAFIAVSAPDTQWVVRAMNPEGVVSS